MWCSHVQIILLKFRGDEPLMSHSVPPHSCEGTFVLIRATFPPPYPCDTP